MIVLKIVPGACGIIFSAWEAVMKLNKDILGLIGKTPLVKINHLSGPEGAVIWAKLEGFNPGGSVKDRIGLAMIEAAER